MGIVHRVFQGALDFWPKAWRGESPKGGVPIPIA